MDDGCRSKADWENPLPPPRGGKGLPASGDFLCVSRADDAVRIEARGLGNMYLAPSLCTFVEAELQAGFRMFVVDLRHCRGMDSTFMGTFIGLAHKIREKGGWFGLVNVSPENLRLLKMLGVVHLVPVHPGDFPLAEGKTTLIFPTGDLQARKSQIHSAHLLLMDADTENRNRFGSFIRALEEEMNGP